MLSMLCVVFVFGAHSFVDWTWYVPGDACVALLCAGWLAGRGPLSAPGETFDAAALARPAGAAPVAEPLAAAPGDETLAASPGDEPLAASGSDPTARRWRLHTVRELGPARIGVALAVVIGALLAAWSQWQPQSSANASQQALALLSTNPAAAHSEAETAVSRDPLSAQALFVLAQVDLQVGERAAARAALRKAVSLQPSNPETWLHLAEYDVHVEPHEALHELEAAIFLNPESISNEAAADGDPETTEIESDYAQDLTLINQTAAPAPAHAPAPPVHRRLP